MYLSQLYVENVRNLESRTLEFSGHFNLVIGANASGKTSLLEAIHLAATSRSFRSHLIQDIITRENSHLLIRAILALDDNARVQIGVMKSPRQTKIKLNSQPVYSSSEVAALFPLVTILPDSLSLVMGAPRERRQLLDWTMFHVEHGFLKVWKDYERCLKQRNAALRKRSAIQDISVWDTGLVSSAEALHRYRLHHIQIFNHHLQGIAGPVFNQSVSLDYLPGWDTERSLIDQLHERIDRDMRLGYTNRGPHRADLLIKVNGLRARTVLSRGQAKLLSALLRIVQAQSLASATGRKPLILIDDLPSELDSQARGRFLALLNDLGAQVIITSTEPSFVDEVADNSKTVFHVEHGKVTKVV